MVLPQGGSFLNALGISWAASAVSGHRHPAVLDSLVARRIEEGAKLFICAAGMSAVLPGIVVGHAGFTVPVIGVALPSTNYPDALDAMLAMTRLPSFVAVSFAGVGASGFRNAAFIAAQILAVSDEALRSKLKAFIERKKPKFELELKVKDGGEKGD